MKIIVDMMGGDNAPLAVLEGAAQAVKEYGVQLIGVGNEALVRKTAAEHNIPLDGIELVNCTETIEMCDEPARAIRQKKDSSIVVGLNMLKEGKGDAFVSAGSTGALHVGASLIVRTLRGVKRPALATMVPAKQQAYLLLDCGANVECRPEMLAAFAVMGSCYVNKVEGRKNPSVALANNGAEESKGTPVLRDAHQLLKTTPQADRGRGKDAAGYAQADVPCKPWRQAGISAAQGRRYRPEAPDGQRGIRWRALPWCKAAGHQGTRLLQGKGHQKRHPAGKDLRGERFVRHHAVRTGRTDRSTEN